MGQPYLKYLNQIRFKSGKAPEHVMQAESLSSFILKRLKDQKLLVVHDKVPDNGKEVCHKYSVTFDPHL